MGDYCDVVVGICLFCFVFVFASRFLEANRSFIGLGRPATTCDTWIFSWIVYCGALDRLELLQSLEVEHSNAILLLRLSGLSFSISDSIIMGKKRKANIKIENQKKKYEMGEKRKANMKTENQKKKHEM